MSLKYTATDELGNSVSGTVKFEVKPRPSYKDYAASRLEPHLTAWDAG